MVYFTLRRDIFLPRFGNSNERSPFNSLSYSFYPLILLPSIFPALSPLSCSWPKCRNQYPFVSSAPPRGNESNWIRLSVPSTAAKFLSPLAQLMTDTLTCTYGSHVIRWRERWGAGICMSVDVFVIFLYQKTECSLLESKMCERRSFWRQGEQYSTGLIGDIVKI